MPLSGWAHHSGSVLRLWGVHKCSPVTPYMEGNSVAQSGGFSSTYIWGKKEEIRWRGQADGWEGEKEGERETECKHVRVRKREKSHRF